MIRFAIIAGLLCLNLPGSALAADKTKLDIYCTAEEQTLAGVKSAHKFRGKFDLKKVTFDMTVEVDNNLKEKHYPAENYWAKYNCTSQSWDFKVSDTSLKITSACNNNEANKGVSVIWKINRSDGTFTQSVDGLYLSKGQCIDMSKRAF